MQNKSCIMNKNYTLQSQRRNSQTENNQTFFYYWHYFIIYIFIIKYIFSPWSWGIMFKMASCSWNISNNNFFKKSLYLWIKCFGQMNHHGYAHAMVSDQTHSFQTLLKNVSHLGEVISVKRKKKACIMILSQLLNK